MQQTDKYQLNLIERDDVFSPDALNESTQKVESALAAEETARKAADTAEAAARTALAQRVAVLEARKVVLGSFVGKGKEVLTIELGFTPLLVFIHGLAPASDFSAFVMGDHVIKAHVSGEGTRIIEGGFRIDDYGGLGRINQELCYIAFA